MTGPVQRLKQWASDLKRDCVALWIAAGDSRTPMFAKLTAAAVAAYALSPIDLIPDFIPVLGYLDDIVIVPLGIALAVRLIPAPLMTEFRNRAAVRVQRPTRYVGAAVILAIWLIGGAVVALWLSRIVR